MYYLFGAFFMPALYLHHNDSKADCHANKGQRYINTSLSDSRSSPTRSHRPHRPHKPLVPSSAWTFCPLVRSLFCPPCPLVLLSLRRFVRSSFRPPCLLVPSSACRFVRPSAPHGLITLITFHSRNKKNGAPQRSAP